MLFLKVRLNILAMNPKAFQELNKAVDKILAYKDKKHQRSALDSFHAGARNPTGRSKQPKELKMTTESGHREKFQRLLRELFQFDVADLDFGIYRVMNHKRHVIEKFIDESLPKAIAEKLNKGALAAQSQVVTELEDAIQLIKETFGERALDSKHNLHGQYHDTPLGKKYQALKTKLGSGHDRAALEINIFNHLYSFFSRYYQDGDFISKRRYSRRKKYAVPYNGEEVFLHWANNDQYYVKTTDQFSRYTFKAGDLTVCFSIRHADVEVNNVQEKRRFFMPLFENGIWDSDTNSLKIPFEYRPLSKEEQSVLTLKGVNGKNRHAVLCWTEETILKKLGEIPKVLAILTREHHRKPDGMLVSVLGHHLCQYTRRNTSDFFVHKDIKGFLLNELDFYLKNEVLNWDEVQASGEANAASWFQIVQVIWSIGRKIIDFLGQIEFFQKVLWEKRKFITEVHYCITVGNLDENFYPEIAACEAQWAEWEKDYEVDIGMSDLDLGESVPDRRVAFLKTCPTLVLDTKHFEQSFIDQMLSSIEDIDSTMDGLLVHGENYQALLLLAEKYRNKVRCTYIDPPFNTESQFAFKDSYRSSTWLSLMNDRLQACRDFITSDGTLYVHLDHNSNFYGRVLLDKLFGEERLLNEVIWRIGWVSGYKTAAPRYVRNHETIFVYGKESQPYFNKANAKIQCTTFREDGIQQQLEQIKKAWGVDKKSPLRMKLVFKDQEDKVYKTGLVSNDLDGQEKEGAYNIEDTWNCNEYEELHSNKIKRNAAEYTPNGSKITQKPEQLLQRIIEISSAEGDTVLDYFAGSGTTPAVAKKLNRKFLAVEMGQYFDSDMLWRMKKVLYGHQVGISKQTPYQGGGCFKYIRLESYEDSLNNIGFDDTASQRALDLDDYLLQYMLKWETKQSETFLNVEKLDRPFSYRLHLHVDGQIRKKLVDIPETFNYLLGLHVKTRRVYKNRGQHYLIYRGTVDGQRTVIIWRETADWEEDDWKLDKEFVEKEGLLTDADMVFVNQDSLIRNAQSLDPVFKARMLSEIQP